MILKYKKKKKKKKRITLKKIWPYFSKYIRLKWAINGKCDCITCGKSFHWQKIQAGHFISRKYTNTFFDEENVMPQCYGCNIGLKGLQWLYGKNLDIMFGVGTAEKVYQRSLIKKTFSKEELEELYKKFKI